MALPKPEQGAPWWLIFVGRGEMILEKGIEVRSFASVVQQAHSLNYTPKIIIY